MWNEEIGNNIIANPDVKLLTDLRKRTVWSRINIINIIIYIHGLIDKFKDFVE